MVGIFHGYVSHNQMVSVFESSASRWTASQTAGQKNDSGPQHRRLLRAIEAPHELQKSSSSSCMLDTRHGIFEILQSTTFSPEWLCWVCWGVGNDNRLSTGASMLGHAMSSFMETVISVMASRVCQSPHFPKSFPWLVS
jgi:hypothetical protein